MYLRKIGKKWYYSLTLYFEDGTKKRIERVGGLTQEDARKAARRELSKANMFGQVFKPEEVRFDEYADCWFENYAEKNLADNTVDSYRNVISQLKQKFGHCLLYKITPMMLQSYINDISSTYRESTLQQRINIMKKLFKDAVEPYRYIDKSPASRLRVPARSQTSKKDEITIFTDEELRKIFLKFPPGTIFHLPIMLAYHMGLRKGECLALLWSDVDFDRNIIRIQRNQYDKSGEIHVYKRTKSKRIRTLEMDSAIRICLLEEKQRQENFARLFGPKYKQNNAVCCHENGTKLKADDLRWFNEWTHKQGMDGSFHTLRHTHATKLIEAGLDLDYVSKRMGHSTVNITSNVYVHMTQKRREAAIKIMDDVL